VVFRLNAFHANVYCLVTLSVTLSLLTASYGFPTSKSNRHSCDALVEQDPWHVTDLVIQDNPSTASTGFSNQFRVSDNNPGLELHTFCTDRLPFGTVGWRSCEDKQIRFRYNPGNLLIQRSYIDDWHVVPKVTHERAAIDLGVCYRLISAITAEV